LILGDGPARGALEGIATDLGLGSSIRFLSGVQHDAVRGVMAAIDVLVLPSRTTPKWKEQFGRVLVEGMAAGCVVVGSSSGAIPEVVGDAGLIFPEDDVEGLAQALRRALGEPGLMEALRIRGRKRVREHYTWEVIASRITDFYARLLAG
jgi:glycosyltransferase involved in cell wall biosynthesis